MRRLTTFAGGVLLGGLLALLLLAAVGCSSCPAKCCATCPPELEVIESTEYVQAPAPELPLACVPEITSAWTDAEAEADPAGWLEALLGDFQAVLNAWLEDRQTIITSNETRPAPPPD